VRSLQDRIAFIINIYQHNKFIESVISISPPKKNAKYIRVIEILLALILVDGRVSITSKERTYCDFILVDNEVSHSVEITSWIRYLSFFTV
jgi:hypothetical protein